MRNVTTFVIMLALLTSSAWPCVSPGNIEGVAFTSGEVLNLQKLIQSGSENVNYLKDGAEPAFGIRYISHYDPRAMVFVGTYGMSYQQNVRLNCMGIVLPVADSANAFARIEVSQFDFAAAVKAELAWLASNGIVDLEAGKIQKIDSALRASGNGGVQYWTHTETVLGYNSWYTNDTLSGVWGESQSAVRSANSLKGCSIIQPGVGLPPNGLEATAIASKIPCIQRGIRQVTVRRLGNGAAIVFFSQMTRTSAVLTAMDLKGAVLFKQQVPAGTRSVYLHQPHGNAYAVFHLSGFGLWLE